MKKKYKAIIWAWIISLLVSLLPMNLAEAAVKANIKHNPKFDEAIVEYGIDVSYHQGEIDWKKVKADGIQFAFIRVAARGYGKKGALFDDTRAKENMLGAQKVEIPFGVYIYSQAITVKEAKEEAEYIIDAIQGYDVELPVVFDFEYHEGGRLAKAGLTDAQRTNICLAFCKHVEKEGYTPMVYANKSMLKDDLNAAAISQSYPTWLAHYTKQTDYDGDYQYWQYTSSGKVNGISGRVDMNVRYVRNENKVNGLKVQSASSKGIRLQWEPVENAIGYEVYRKTVDTEFELYHTISKQNATTFSDAKVKANTKYIYKVRALYEEEEYSEFSRTVFSYGSITKKPTITKGKASYEKLEISWKTLEMAEGYEIWRYNDSKKAYQKYATIEGQDSLSYEDKNFHADTTCYYKVRAYRTEGESVIYSPYSQTLKVKTLPSVKGVVSAVSLNVRAIASVTGEKLTTIKQDTIISISGSEGEWYRTSVVVGGKKKTAYVSKAYVQPVEIGNTTLKNTSLDFDKVKLTWSKVSNATGYVLQQYSASKKAYVTLAVLKNKNTISFLHQGLNANTTYKYRIRPYRKVRTANVYSDYSNVVSVKTKKAMTGLVSGVKVNIRKGPGTSYKVLKTVKKNTMLTVTGSRGQWYCISASVNGKKTTAYISKSYAKLVKVGKPTLKKNSVTFDKIKLSWGEIPGADGYILQRYSSSKKAYITMKTISNKSIFTWRDENLNAETTYKYRIRAYRIIKNKKIYGDYSTVISVKTGKGKTATIRENCKLRKGPATSYKSVLTAKKGTEVSVVGSRGDWYRLSVVVKGKKIITYTLKKWIKL